MVMSRNSVLQPISRLTPYARCADLHRTTEIARAPHSLAISDYREAKRHFDVAYIKAKLHEHDGNIARTPPL